MTNGFYIIIIHAHGLNDYNNLKPLKDPFVDNTKGKKVNYTVKYFPSFCPLYLHLTVYTFSLQAKPLFLILKKRING